MDYEQYAKTYESLLAKLLTYDLGTIGHAEYCEKLGELEDSNPEHAKKYDSLHGGI